MVVLFLDRKDEWTSIVLGEISRNYIPQLVYLSEVLSFILKVEAV
jgi:hypothetical protein